MGRFFNTTGPCNPAEHYMLDPGKRLARFRVLVEENRYFTLAAGRQSGKTTLARVLADEWNASGRRAAVWVDLELGGPKSEPLHAMTLALKALDRAVRRDVPGVALPSAEDVARFLSVPDSALTEWLQAVAAACPRPLVLFLDEADSFVGAAMLSFLTQLRAGYLDRSKTPFPASVALIGQRRVRDYALSVDERRTVAWPGSLSPFNIEAETITLGNFSPSDVAELLAQHTSETGQVFESAAVERVFELSQGHPWLVNALAYEPAIVDVTDRSVPIGAAHVDAARDRIVQARRTHLASLEDRLREERVRRVMEPMITGRELGDVPETDVEYVQGLGLVRRLTDGALHVSNPVYREVILRQLSMSPLTTTSRIPVTWVRPDGRLDLPRLLDAFLAFWRQHGAVLMGSVPYHEAAPHLVMMAFLHRVENGGGRLDREFAAGTGRMDLMLRFGPDRFAFEIKVWRDTDDTDPAAAGLAQLDTRLSALGLETGWLVAFDRRPDLPRLSERTRAETARTPAGREVTVVRA